MIYFTADQHFGHDAIIEYCKRPYKNSTQMDRVLIVNWNNVVKEDDVVYVIGDFSMVGPSHKQYLERITRKLNGEKHLILGNHDRLKPFDYVDIGFTTVHTTLQLPGTDFIMHHDPSAVCIDKSKKWIVGHVHDLFKTLNKGAVINVGVDVWGFHPVSLDAIIQCLESGVFEKEEMQGWKRHGK